MLWIRNNVLGLAAIFIALGGSAVAAQVSSHDGRAHAAKKVKKGPRGPAGPTGAQGPAGPAAGAAGGALSGSYPNPSIAVGAVGASQLAAGGVSSVKLSQSGFTDAGLPDAHSSACNTHGGVDNAWANQNPFSANNVSYFRDPYGVVHLRGVVCRIGTPPSGTTIFTLPAGDRPQFQEVMLRATSSGTTRLDINPDGTVVAPDVLGGWVSLDGLSFSCAGSGAPGCPA